jgi:hypothetical protein
MCPKIDMMERERKNYNIWMHLNRPRVPKPARQAAINHIHMRVESLPSSHLFSLLLYGWLSARASALLPPLVHYSMSFLQDTCF